MSFDNPTLTITLALAMGVIAQAAAIRLRIPGIVLLLLAGVLLGPELLGIIQPAALGPALSDIVGLSVAIILFEGGMGLNIERLRGEAGVIRRLILSGALITAAGAAIAANVFLGWPWPIAIVFGSLMMVTGPTVITPLLRRIRVNQNVSTILEAEAVLIDPIGAIVSVVVLEIVLAETTGGAARHLIGLPTRLLLGAFIGVAGGVIISQIIKSRRLIAEGLENVLTLALVLALHEISDAIQPESGILAVTVAGLIVGNVRTRVARELRDFKEQLTVMLVGALFILLAANVQLGSVLALGWGGVATVLSLMLIVRPLDIASSTRGSALTTNERLFLAWLSPRGIVAAAVATVFARRLSETGSPVGVEFAALVFLVIAATVLIQGLSGGWVATRLGIRRPSNTGYIIVGANALGRRLAHALRRDDVDVIMIDTNASDVRAAEAEGLRAMIGNAHNEDVLELADIEGRHGFAAVTPNEGANLLLAQEAKRRFRVPRVYAAIRAGKAAATVERAEESGVGVLFGGPIDVDSWIRLARLNRTSDVVWTNNQSEPVQLEAALAPDAGAVPLVIRRKSGLVPASFGETLQAGDELRMLSAKGVATSGPVQ